MYMAAWFHNKLCNSRIHVQCIFIHTHRLQGWPTEIPRGRRRFQPAIKKGQYGKLEIPEQWWEGLRRAVDTRSLCMEQCKPLLSTKIVDTDYKWKHKVLKYQKTKLLCRVNTYDSSLHMVYCSSLLMSVLPVLIALMP